MQGDYKVLLQSEGASKQKGNTDLRKIEEELHEHDDLIIEHIDDEDSHLDFRRVNSENELRKSIPRIDDIEEEKTPSNEP